MRVYVEGPYGYKPIETDILWKIAGVALIVILSVIEIIRVVLLGL